MFVITAPKRNNFVFNKKRRGVQEENEGGIPIMLVPHEHLSKRHTLLELAKFIKFIQRVNIYQGRKLRLVKARVNNLELVSSQNKTQFSPATFSITIMPAIISAINANWMPMLTTKGLINIISEFRKIPPLLAIHGFSKRNYLSLSIYAIRLNARRLYTVWDDSSRKIDSPSWNDLSLSIYTTRLNAWRVIQGMTEIASSRPTNTDQENIGSTTLEQSDSNIGPNTLGPVSFHK